MRVRKSNRTATAVPCAYLCHLTNGLPEVRSFFWAFWALPSLFVFDLERLHSPLAWVSNPPSTVPPLSPFFRQHCLIGPPARHLACWKSTCLSGIAARGCAAECATGCEGTRITDSSTTRPLDSYCGTQLPKIEIRRGILTPHHPTIG